MTTIDVEYLEQNAIQAPHIIDRLKWWSLRLGYDVLSKIDIRRTTLLGKSPSEYT
ncbi:MAG: hypothetical protein GQ553_03500, partial [Nitrosomonadaceae bacterium]|nr:hypothetical protein [Nitrosomonadaceae bacterium]